MSRPQLAAMLDYYGYAEVLAAGDVRVLAASVRCGYAEALNSAVIPLRTSIQGKEPFFAFDCMPAYSASHRLFVVKIGAVLPQREPDAKTVHALVAAFCCRSGQPFAVLDGNAVTHLKCAAVAAMVTDACARADARKLGLIGAGVQARVQLRAALAVRQIEQVGVFSRDRVHLQAFVSECEAEFQQVRFMACASADEAVREADIVSTATTSVEPLLEESSLLRPGLHINCFGNHTPRSRELPRSVLERGSILLVEDKHTAIAEAGEVHAAAYTLGQIGEIDSARLRRERTVFSSTGHAFLDLLAVDHVLAGLGVRPNPATPNLKAQR